MMIQEKIREESLTRHFEHRAEDPARVGAPHADDEQVVGLTGPFGNSTRQEKLSTGEIPHPESDEAADTIVT